MSQEESAEKMLERNVAKMGDALGLVYTALRDDVTRLHAKWIEYRTLYAHSPERVELLNKAAGHFFGVLQRTLYDDLLLHLARLTDRAETPGPKGVTRSNLSVQQLPLLVPAELRAGVDRAVTAAVTACELARAWRNKIGAHTDLKTALVSVELPDMTRAQFDAAVAVLRDLLNVVERHYWQSTVLYEDTIVPLNDAEALVRCLDIGVQEQQRRRDERRRRGEGGPKRDDRRRYASRVHGGHRTAVRRASASAAPAPEARQRSGDGHSRHGRRGSDPRRAAPRHADPSPDNG